MATHTHACMHTRYSMKDIHSISGEKVVCWYYLIVALIKKDIVLLTTATASEANSSSLVSTTKYAIFVRT